MNTVALGDVVDFYSGGTPSKSKPELWKGEIPWFSAKDIKQPRLMDSVDHISNTAFATTSLRKIPAGTVVLVVRGMILAHTVPICIIDVDSAINQDLKALIPRQEIDASYLSAMLRAQQASILQHVSTAAHGTKKLESRVLESIRIPLPPLVEQRRIAGILSQADAIRTKRRQVVAHLDELADSIFLELFGEPVNNSHGLPMHRLGDEATSLQYGPRFYNEAYSNEGLRIVRITDLDRTGRLNFERMPKMSVTDDQIRKFRLSPGDIVFARTGATVGKLAIIRESDPPCIAGAYFIRIRLSELVLPDYVAAVLRSRSVQSIIWMKSQQSAQQNFSGPGLRSLPLPVPPLELQHEFATRVEHVNVQRELARLALAADNELFASLQARAFKGEL